MIQIRRSGDRGHFDHGWLDTYHTFSFAAYHDPRHMGFRTLRVMNEDRVRGGAGFGEHGHRDMEIITYVLEGALAHRDSMGNGTTIRAGEVQRMRAGRGVVHAEFNASESEPVHFFQIWITPDRLGLDPGYEQRGFDRAAKLDRWALIASADGRDGSLSIAQDVSLEAAILSPGKILSRPLRAGRHAWVQVAVGRIHLNGEALEAGDGAAVSDEHTLELRDGGDNESEILLFDLA
ncbi:MAG: pirin family protein [Phycisphaerae bacterium]|nr:pirin family protein [Phycisphaerae bacterium]